MSPVIKILFTTKKWYRICQIHCIHMWYIQSFNFRIHDFRFLITLDIFDRNVAYQNQETNSKSTQHEWQMSNNINVSFTRIIFRLLDYFCSYHRNPTYMNVIQFNVEGNPIDKAMCGNHHIYLFYQDDGCTKIIYPLLVKSIKNQRFWKRNS